MGLVQDPNHGAKGANALDKAHAIHHRPGCTVPLGNHEDVALAVRVDRLFELGSAAGVLAAGLLAKDTLGVVLRFSRPERTDLMTAVDTKAAIGRLSGSILSQNFIHRFSPRRLIN